MIRRIPIAVIAFLVLASSLEAAALRTTIDFAFQENAPPGTQFWCAFPNAADQWDAIMYQRVPRSGPWPGRFRYAPLAGVSKRAGAKGAAYYKSFTVPAHSSRYCVLAVFRNGVQQPYRGWTQVPPFGWHTFGVIQPLQVLVAEYPPRAPARDIGRFERNVRRRRGAIPLP